MSAPRRRGRLASPGALAALVLLALLGLHLAVHQDEGGWVAKATWHDEATVDGHLVEWEWIHVREAVDAIDGTAVPARISSQNIYRFAGAYLIAALREPLGSFYAAAVAAHLLAWAGAAAAVYALAARAGGRGAPAVAAATLVGTAPGYIGYLGQVDPHPYGYAGVALWLLVADRAFGAPVGRRPEWGAAVSVGLTLCLAGYALEVAYPLLLVLWVYYGGLLLLRRCPALVAAGSLVTATLAFLVPYLGLRLLVERWLGIQVEAFNEPFTYLRDNLAQVAAGGPLAWLEAHVPALLARWPAAFPLPVTLLALAGGVALPRRWRWWAVTVVGAFGAAITLTKPATRELFLVMPAVYVLAAGGAAALGHVAARRLVPAPAPARRAWVAGAILAALLAVVLNANADLWGDYTLPFLWYRVQ